MKCTHAGWMSTAILAMLCVLAPVASHAQEATPVEPPTPVLEPGQQPPDPPVVPDPPPEPDIVSPPEAVVPLYPVVVAWKIADPDAALADTHRWTSVYCGRSAAHPYGLGRWDFPRPATSGTVELPGPAACTAVLYYFVPSPEAKFPTDGLYRYSDAAAAVQVDPLKPVAPELLPVGMETPTLRCAAATQRCTTSRLQTSTKTRDGVRTRTCSCVLVE